MASKLFLVTMKCVPIWNLVPTEPTSEAEVSCLIDGLNRSEEQHLWKEIIPASCFTLLQGLMHQRPKSQLQNSWQHLFSTTNNYRRPIFYQDYYKHVMVTKFHLENFSWKSQELIVSKHLGGTYLAHGCKCSHCRHILL